MTASYSKRYYHKNKDRIDEAAKVWAVKNPRRRAEHLWASHIKRKYGIDRVEYEAKLAQQDGSCAICKTKDPRTKLGHFCVDHDHKTGKIRGLLCNPCNKAIGLLEDRIESLVAAIKYLQCEF